MYKVELTDSAERDMDNIVDYIKNDLLNPTAAANFMDAISEKISDLRQYPYMYELSRNNTLAKRGYHRIVIKGYIALYLIDDDKNAVYIARVFYGKREYEKLI